LYYNKTLSLIDMFHKCVLPTCAEYVFNGKLSTDRISSIVGAKSPFSFLIITALLSHQKATVTFSSELDFCRVSHGFLWPAGALTGTLVFDSNNNRSASNELACVIRNYSTFLIL